MRLRSKRLVSLLLAGSMMVSMVPASAVTAFAAETKSVAVMTEDGEAKTSGTCGANVSWNYASGVLTISGTGAMADFTLPNEKNPETNTNPRPWEAYADQIKEVKIADTVTKIGDRAFARFTALKKVNIPASTNDFGNYIFSGDTALTTVTWDAGFNAPTITDKDSNVSTHIGQYVPTSMFDGCTSLGEGIELTTWLPSSFKGIGCAAFRNTAFTVDFENWKNLTYIGAYAFVGMQNLKSFTLTDDITLGLIRGSMDASRAFFGSGLESLTIKAKTVPIGFASNCTNLKTLTLENTVQQIGYSAFSNIGITELTVPKTNEKLAIGKTAFMNDSQLKKVTFQGNVSLDQATFSGCGIEDFTVTEGANVECLSSPFGVYSSIASATTSIQKVEIMGSLPCVDSTHSTQWMWNQMFHNNNSLTDVTVSGSNMQYVNATAFPKMKTLKVIADDNMTTFNASLAGCTALKAVDLTDCKGITSYADNCFDENMNDSAIIYVKDADAAPTNAPCTVLVVNGGTVDLTKEGFNSVTKAGYKAVWYDGENVTTDTVPQAGHTYTVKWADYDTKVDAEVKVNADPADKTVEIDVTVTVPADTTELDGATATLNFTDANGNDDSANVAEVAVDGKKLDNYKNVPIAGLMNGGSDTATVATYAATQNKTAKLTVTYKTPGEHNVEIVLNAANGDVICKQTATVKIAPEPGTLNLTACTAKLSDGTEVKNGDKVPVGAEVTVTFNKDFYADSNLVLSGWQVTPDTLTDVNSKLVKDITADSFTFVMPETENGVTIEAQTKTADTEDDSWDAATVVTGVAIGAGAAVLTYHIGTELYAEQVLGDGVAVPKTREEVALKAWELAGKPAVAIEGEPLSETAQAEKWAVESGLMQNVDGSFNGQKKMNKLKALRVLDSAKKMNAQ